MIAFLIFWPLLAGLILLVTRFDRAKELALAASLAELAVSIFIAFQFDKDAGNQFSLTLSWISSLGINFSVALDGISLLLVLLTTGLIPFIILSSFGQPTRPSGFYGLILIMQMALIGVFVARDGFLFYLFWEMALIPIYFICLLWGGEGRARITLKFFIYTLAGSLLMLAALVYVYLQTPAPHSFDIEALYTAGGSLTGAEQSLVFWGLFLAFAIKMPIFPFHTWQPDTYAVAPVQGTMLLSAIMLKMGIFGLIRWLLPMVPLGITQWGPTAILLSVIGIVYASFIAVVQKDFKRLIAYSSIAHVGLISAGVLTLSKIGIQGAMIQMVSHGIIVFSLFYVVEIIFDRTKSRALTELGGIRNVAPALSSVFLFILLGSVALPLTSGFVGEFLLINSLVKYQLALGAVAGITIILGAVYMLRAFQKSMSGESTPKTSVFHDLTLQEKVVLYPMVLLVILIGIYPGPIMDISNVATDNILKVLSDFYASTQ